MAAHGGELQLVGSVCRFWQLFWVEKRRKLIYAENFRISIFFFFFCLIFFLDFLGANCFYVYGNELLVMSYILW